MEMKPINVRTGGVDEQFTLASWTLTPASNRMTSANKAQDEVQDQVKKIVMTLFCELGPAQQHTT